MRIIIFQNIGLSQTLNVIHRGTRCRVVRGTRIILKVIFSNTEGLDVEGLGGPGSF